MNDEDVADMLSTIAKIQNTQTIEEFLELSGELYEEWSVNPIFGLSVDADMHNSLAGSIWLEPFSDPGGQKLKQICVGGRMGQSVAMYYRIALSDSGMDGDEPYQDDECSHDQYGKSALAERSLVGTCVCCHFAYLLREHLFLYS